MVRSDFCDTIQFEQNSEPKIQLVLAPESSGIRPENFPLDESNLIIRAASELRELTGTALGATISIVKRVPAEAGLAGGSSNAATTLLGLNQLWDLRLEKIHLHQIAAKLGSDINFFVEDCRAAVCRGRGEIVEPIDCHGEFHVVAFHPGVGNPTPAVFSKLVIAEAQQQHSSEAVQAALQQGDTQRLVQAIFNRLTDAARSINPEMDMMMADVTVSESPGVYVRKRRHVFCDGDKSARSEAVAISDCCRRPDGSWILSNIGPQQVNFHAQVWPEERLRDSDECFR